MQNLKNIFNKTKAVLLYILEYLVYLAKLIYWKIRDAFRKSPRLASAITIIIVVLILALRFVLPAVITYINTPRPLPLTKAPASSGFDYVAKDSRNQFTGYIGDTKTNTPKIEANFGTANKVDFVLTGLNTNIAPPTQTQNEVTFKEVRKNVDLSYQTLVNGIKEQIIVKSPTPGNSFTFTLNTQGATPIRIGPEIYGPVFYDAKGKYLFNFEKPYAVDAKGARNDNVLLAIHKAAGDTSYTASVVLNQKWLADPARVYPIKIDPTVTYTLSSNFSAGILNRVLDTGSPNLTTYYQELPADQNTVGLWHMNEASGTTNVADSTTNANTGTAYSSTDVTTGVLGNARTFDGANDYVQMASSNSLAIKSAITLEAWIYPTAASQVPWIINKGVGADGTAKSYELYLNQTTPTLVLRLHNGTTYANATSADTVPLNTWSHVAGTWDGNNMNVYINGKLEGSTIFSTTLLVNTDPVVIGRRRASLSTFQASTNFTGNIDEVRISNVARSAEEIRLDAQRRPYSVYTSDVMDLLDTTGWNSFSWTELGVGTGDGETPFDSTGLVAQWNFNDTIPSSTAANNAGSSSCGGTGANCNGTLTGFTAGCGYSSGAHDACAGEGWTTDSGRWPASSPQALVFNGTADYVNVPDTNALTFGNGTTDTPFSISMWVFPKSFAAQQWLINKRGSSQEEYQLAISTAGQIQSALFSGLNSAIDIGKIANTPLNLGSWNHVVFTYDGSRTENGIKIYINGVPSGLSSNSAGSYVAMNNSTSPLVIGKAGWNASGYFNGIIDSTAIYSRALTASEILSNYNAGNLEIQTRVGSTTDPNDGSWEAWRPTTSEAQILSFDTDSANWTWDSSSTFIPTAKSDDTNIKVEGSGSTKVALGQLQADANTIGLWHLDETGGSGAYLQESSFPALNTGSGADGACTVTSGTTNLNSASCAGRGTADAVAFSSTVLTGVGSTSITLSATPTGLSAGNEVLIINLQGTSGANNTVGQYETHTIASISTNTLNFTDSVLNFTYDGTTQKIMVQRVPNYTTVSVSAGANMTVNAWNGTIGGVLFFRANSTVTVNGTIHTNYLGYTLNTTYSGTSAFYGGGGGGGGGAYLSNGNQGAGGTGGTSGGGNGSPGVNGAPNGGGAGGTGGGSSNGAGAAGATPGSTCGGGGGGGGGGGAYGGVGGGGGGAGGVGQCPSGASVGGKNGATVNGTNSVDNSAGGGGNGGGGYGTSGGIGKGGTGGSNAGLDGSGNTGGKGGGGSGTGTYAGGGGGGGGGGATYGTLDLSTLFLGSPGGNAANLPGGIIGIFGNSITVDNSTGSISANGGDFSGKSGGSSGGSVLIEGNTLTLNTSRVTANGGAGGSSGGNGGAGGAGRIAIFANTSVSGTTSPTYSTISRPNGTPTGTTVVNGITGKARSFNGSSDYISVGALYAGSAIQSVEFWTYPTSTTTRFIDFDGGTHYVWANAGTVTATGFTSPTIYVDGAVSSTITANQWHHVAVTTATSFNASNVTIGKQSTNYMNGYLDEMRISNIARTAENIAEDYRLGRDHYLNRTISSTDLSSAQKLEFNIAADRPGTYLSATIGNNASNGLSGYPNYQPDTNTVGLWHLDENSPPFPAGIALWIRADSLGLADGTAVSSWTDLSGNGRNLTQATGSKQPIFKKNILNALPIVRFTAASVQEIVNTTNFAAPVTVIYVGKQTGGANGRVLTTNGTNNWLLGFWGGLKNQGYFAGWVTNATSPATDTNWHVFSAVETGALSSVYADGALIVSNAGGVAGPNTISIGCTAGTECSNADVAEVLIFNSALSNTDRALVEGYLNAKYNINSGPGPYSNTKDASGNSNNGVPVGTTSVQGQIGKAKRFNGTSDYINIPHSTSLNISGNNTIEAWINTSAPATNYQMIVTKTSSGADDGYELRFSATTGKLQLVFGGTTPTNLVGNTVLAANTWYHVASTYDGATAKLYVNGILDAQVAMTGAVGTNTQPVNIGRRQDGLYFSGIIDEVRVSNVARSASDIRAAYEVGKRTHQITIDFAANLTSAIANNSVTSFTIDATKYGLSTTTSNIYQGDKIIIHENYNGTDYYAQGTVNSVTPGTNTIVVESWDSGYSFPSGGFTTNANVFKWQKEYMDLGGSLPSQRNGVTTLSLRETNGQEGRTIWLDDLRSAGIYLTTPTGSTPTSTGGSRYFQYRIIQSSSDYNVSPSFSSATLDFTSNLPNNPTINTPTMTANTIVWNFAEPGGGAAVTGFKLYDSSGTEITSNVDCSSGTSCIETGLTPNTQYTRKVAGYNVNGHGLFSGTASAYTLAAVPATPVTSSATATSLQLTVGAGTNPSGTQLAIYQQTGTICTISGGNYIQDSSGTLGASAAWKTAAAWGTISLTGLDLNANEYLFCAKAINANNVETGFVGESSNGGWLPLNTKYFTVTENMTYANRYTDGINGSRWVAGLDHGSGTTNDSILTLQKGTLTVLPNDTVVAGSFILAGGSIALPANGTGQLKPSIPLWAVDADNDGYIVGTGTTAKLYYGAQPTGGKRRYTLSTLSKIDCDDSDATFRSTKITGGNTSTSGGNKIHTFLATGTLVVTCPASISANYLIVAGGGGGNGGGGGAGGMRTGSTTLSATSYTATVGNGTGGTVKGQDSSFNSIVSTGGGYGGPDGANGGNGGSGGAAGGCGPYAVGTGIAGQGNQGGSLDPAYCLTGGGGGAGAAGNSAWSGGCGTGGIGAISSITGTPTYYAGGGGGKGGPTICYPVAGGGGGGGGGNSSAISAGTPNTGGGGGPGMSGGSGIIIISYPDP